MSPAAFLALLGRLPPEVIGLVVKIVSAIAKSPDPKAAAARALEEAARAKAFDELQRARRPRR